MVGRRCRIGNAAPHSSSHKFDCLGFGTVTWSRSVSETSVISAGRRQRTETGSVMIDVLRMGNDRPCCGIYSQRPADANRGMRT